MLMKGSGQMTFVGMGIRLNGSLAHTEKGWKNHLVIIVSLNTLLGLWRYC